MLAVAHPPPYALRIRSDDPDEVTSWAAQRDGYHSRVVHGAGPYGFRAAVLEGQSVWAAWARTRLGQTLRARAQRPFVQVPIDAPQQYAFGRNRIGVAAGTLVFVSPGTEMSRRSGPGLMFAMDIDDAALASEVQRRRPGAAPTLPQIPQALELSKPLLRVLNGAIADLIRGFDPEASSSQRTHCESRLIAGLADALTVPSVASGAGRLATQRVQDLEAWIDEHLADAITMGRLCEVAQASERSLQLAFQARRGMSPMRFVCERRLAAVHRRISKADHGDDITRIATGMGFTHLGRFAMAYREAYGELPSRTLLRSRGTSVRNGVAPSA